MDATEPLDELFNAQVHAVVCQLSDWMQAEKPEIDRLMPALAVVLGRVIARRAGNLTELYDMLNMAGNTAVSAAHEDWERIREDTNTSAHH
jgi:hypothetical protein